MEELRDLKDGASKYEGFVWKMNGTGMTLRIKKTSLSKYSIFSVMIEAGDVQNSHHVNLIME